MSFDPSKISIISSTKVDAKKLTNVGDTDASLAPKQMQETQKHEKRCNLCCLAYGAVISLATVSSVAAAGTIVTIRSQNRLNYSLNGTMRQILWITFPGVLVGATMHYFLSEAMWSSKNNSWGQAWIKAILMNSVLWGAGIGLCTGVWRKVLPLTAAGRRIFYRYPVSAEPLEMRVMRSGKEFFTGMGWSYWLSGLASGNMAPIILISFAVYNERPYMIMAPGGGYGNSCMPPWRREHMALLASPAGEKPIS